MSQGEGLYSEVLCPKEKGLYSEVPYLEGEIKIGLRFELQFLIKYTVDLNIDCIQHNVYLHRKSMGRRVRAMFIKLNC